MIGRSTRGGPATRSTTKPSGTWIGGESWSRRQASRAIMFIGTHETTGTGMQKRSPRYVFAYPPNGVTFASASDIHPCSGPRAPALEPELQNEEGRIENRSDSGGFLPS